MHRHQTFHDTMCFCLFVANTLSLSRYLTYEQSKTHMFVDSVVLIKTQ